MNPSASAANTNKIPVGAFISVQFVQPSFALQPEQNDTRRLVFNGIDDCQGVPLNLA